ncbi:uncharacterized protein N7477_008724 [Penicillium maclennaniae]|uniref:uncharacterized protein n=1 Tax=Penicillium maclennaniae TaxID=1343394 RepID=UPI00254087F8|nr:uncharacterized protein N7477_008724 [Penicillium maclennaniae]KAJ5666276.1 hypothetical protein N7477_008724 [Penicillium maclennaniae]
MGVGDYVHSKEVGQPRTPADLGPSQRHLWAEQARVEMPMGHLRDSNGNGRASSPRFKPPVSHPLESRAPGTKAQRDMFDTDVEGVDDSTIAETSVFGFDDGQVHSRFHANDDDNTSPRPSYLPRPTRHSRSSFGGGLGDKAVKKAGFNSSDYEETESQLTSSIGDDGDDEKTEVGEKVEEPSSWQASLKYRSTGEPLSKRLENFWSASRKPLSESMGPAPADPQAAAPMNPSPESQPRKLGHMLPSTAARKIKIPHSMSVTPRTRFSPPKPSLLDRLDISPTRHGSEPPPQVRQPLNIPSFQPSEHGDDDASDAAGIDETIRVSQFSSRQASEHSSSAFDVTNLTDLSRDDHDEMNQNPFFARSSTKRGRPEPFEKTPSPPPTVKSPSLPPAPPFVPDLHSPNDAVSELLRSTEENRQTYLSRMSVDEWEDCGDQLIDRFSHLLIEMKKLRRARRQTAAVFEAEMRRRHEEVEGQDAELSTKLNEMRTGGAEVLRGRSNG